MRPNVQPVEELETSGKRKLNKIIYFVGGKISLTKIINILFLNGFDTGNNKTEVKCAVKTLVQSTYFFEGGLNE
jgi:hypothetical protein